MSYEKYNFAVRVHIKYENIFLLGKLMEDHFTISFHETSGSANKAIAEYSKKTDVKDNTTISYEVVPISQSLYSEKLESLLYSDKFLRLFEIETFISDVNDFFSVSPFNKYWVYHPVKNKMVNTNFTITSDNVDEIPDDVEFVICLQK
jgi:hypothetical protein